VAKIYISSTFADLKDYREKVYHALRQMHHDAIAMEDYVATDQRPLDRCLADVAACDLYIGIFAWRYGYIPPKDNPEQKSITELEYRKAGETGKSRLIYLLDKKAPWPSTAMDQATGDSDNGRFITELRRELEQEKLVSFFETADQLVGLVGPAVYIWEKEKNNGDVLAVLTGYHEKLIEVQHLIADAFTLFSDGDDIYPDQCDGIVDFLRTIHLPVYGLLDAIKSLPMTVGFLRYQLGGKLHHVEELTNELIQLIVAFRAICRTSSRRVATQRQDIQRKLEGFVQDIGTINGLYKQLVVQFPSTLVSTSTPPSHTIPSSTAATSVDSPKTPAIPYPTDPTDPTDAEKTNLLEIIHRRYDRQEFILLCAAMGTSIEDLEEGGLRLKMWYLIDYCVRHNMYQQLLEKMRKDHSDLSGII